MTARPTVESAGLFGFGLPLFLGDGLLVRLRQLLRVLLELRRGILLAALELASTRVSSCLCSLSELLD